MYPSEIEIKETTNSTKYVKYLVLVLENDYEGKPVCKIFDKRVVFNFSIVNFQYLCGNIPASLNYEVYVSQSIRYSRACS